MKAIDEAFVETADFALIEAGETLRDAVVMFYFLHHEFCRQHKTTRVTPAMEVGIETTFRDAECVVSLIGSRAPKPRRPKPYRKRTAR